VFDIPNCSGITIRNPGTGGTRGSALTFLPGPNARSNVQVSDESWDGPGCSFYQAGQSISSRRRPLDTISLYKSPSRCIWPGSWGAKILPGNISPGMGWTAGPDVHVTDWLEIARTRPATAPAASDPNGSQRYVMDWCCFNGEPGINRTVPRKFGFQSSPTLKRALQP